MRILGIDSLSRRQSSAVLDSQQVLSFVESEYTPQELLARRKNDLLEVIERALADSGTEIDDLDGISLSIGPGSFTGIRIGLATVLGLTFGREIMTAGIDTLSAIADHAVEQKDIHPVVQLRKTEWVTRIDDEYTILHADEWEDLLGNTFPAVLGEPPRDLTQNLLSIDRGLGVSIARLGMKQLTTSPVRPEGLTALYLTECYAN